MPALGRVATPGGTAHKVKEEAGKLGGDRSTELGGKYDQGKGKVKEGIGDLKQGMPDDDIER